MSFFGNITFRKRRRQSDSQQIDEDLDTTTNTLDGSSSSMPAISDDEDSLTTDLRQQINKLKSELNAAHEEIVNLNLENTNLKSEIEELKKAHDLHKKVADSLKNTCITPRRKNKEKRKNAPRQPFTPVTPSLIEQPGINSLSRPIKLIEPEHQTAKEKPVAENIEPTTGKKRSQNCRKITESAKNETNYAKTNKITTLSSNSKNKVLDIAEDSFGSKSQLCHYITPNARFNEKRGGGHASL